MMATLDDAIPTRGRFRGRVAVVTGAARGIGRAVALRLAREGAEGVVVLDVRREEGRETVRLVEEAGGPAPSRALFVEADVSRAEQVEAAAERVRREFGRCHVLVNDAGISGRPIGDGPVHRCSLETWERVLAVNLTGVFLSSRSFIPLMMEEGGAVVSIASDDALLGSLPPTDTHAYSASKGGVIALTRAMAVSYAASRIRVNAVAPGWVATPMTADLRSDPQMAARLAAACPLNRIATAEEIAGAVAFLASDDAAFVTGVTLPVEGGSTVW
ncbi:SDR family NAD(P)-dependent oxidoreductase [Limnochorda pilosa]|nr:glucose 1-dehydrogenase [Limnochorda pilosa]